MKIVLCNPPWPHETHPMLWGVRAGSRWPHFQRRHCAEQLPRYVPFPFFLAIAAAIASEKGHEVFLIDAVAENMCVESFLQAIKSQNPDLVFCETATPSLEWDRNVWQKIRDHTGNVLICGGGMHCSELAEELVKIGDLDFWIKGEYEYSLSELSDVLERQGDVSSIRGIVRREGTNAGKGYIEDVNVLPSPLYEQLPVCNYGDPVCGLPAPVAQTWLSRGCPFKCTFCVWPQLFYGNRVYRVRETDLALDEVETLTKRYGCESFYFDDDTTNIGEERMIGLGRRIRERGLAVYPWSMMARADCMTERMIEAFASAGMYSVKYGVESIAPSLLKACDKCTDLARMKKTLKLTRSAGIKMHLTFTLGLPGETTDTVRQTVDFALETAPETAQFSLCTPFPGTLFFNECKRNGWLVTEDWSQYLGSGKAVIETPWLKAAELEACYIEACERWGRFCSERLQERRNRVLGELRIAAGQGQTWEFRGDKKFADFLFKDMPGEVQEKLVDTGGADVMVIISKRDEEAIWRRLKRNGNTDYKSVIRLYG